ncbi:MAG: type II toxin-antitoxin system RelE/ParE family toxin [Methanothrix sp.]|nr:type II toxin-antitoxin system RelE/ParE family toxin [Methanothrix sp.]
MNFDSTPEFDEQLSRLTRKNKALEQRLLKKIGQILDNPSIGAPKHHQLRHARGSHVDPYVIVYVVKNDIITFLCVDHHDFVYDRAVKILGKWQKEIED